MAQTQCLTTEGLTELAALIAGGSATEIESMVCLKTSCTAEAAATYAGVTKATESGMTIANCDSVTSAALVITAYHTFTAGEAATIKGAIACNNDDDAAMGIVCFAADVVMETSDTLKVTMIWTMTDTTA